MSNIPTHTSYDTWTVAELIDAISIEPRGNKKVTIPEFQRRLVWPRKKQMGLIHSIKSGFPFGSLLLYKDADSVGSIDYYKLIDGLQRTQTLKQYTDHPNSGFNREELSDGFIDLIAKEINVFSDLDCQALSNKERIKRRILEWVWDSRGFAESTGWSVSAFTDVLLKEMLELEDETYELYIAHKSLLAPDSQYYQQVQGFLNAIQHKTDLSRVKVPVIIYSGLSDHLAEVFVRLNREGIQLHRYEIYAAQWLDYRNKIANSDIVDAIWRKYGELENAGFSLDVTSKAPDSISRKNRKYTLFEYVFGFGQLLTREFPLFFKSVKVDQPSPFGFNLISSCIAGSVAEKDVRRLPDNTRGLNLSHLEESLFESIEFVYQLLKPVLKMQREGSTKIPYFHSDLQIVSLLAAAFKVRYNTNDLSENETWAEKRETLAKNLPMFYLFDILRENWRGSGDSRLADVLSNERFLKSPPPESIWRQVLNVWFSNNLNDRQHDKSYIRDDWPEYLFLRYVFVHSLRRDQVFQVKHLVPIQRLITPPSHYYEYYGPINTVGNLALVPSNQNIDFEQMTFHEYLNKQRNVGAIRGPGRYHDELHKWESMLVSKADILPSELSEKAFESFLRKRFELLKGEFFRAWRDHIPPDTTT